MLPERDGNYPYEEKTLIYILDIVYIFCNLAS